MSRHSEDMAVAMQEHGYHFGDEVQYRETVNDTWADLENVVVHKEEVKQRKTGGTTWSSVVVREIFIADADRGSTVIKINGQIKIGESVYTVEKRTTKGGRQCFHLLRVSVAEKSRPNYRDRA
jgi:hypothetical protein